MMDFYVRAGAPGADLVSFAGWYVKGAFVPHGSAVLPPDWLPASPPIFITHDSFRLGPYNPEYVWGETEIAKLRSSAAEDLHAATLALIESTCPSAQDTLAKLDRKGWKLVRK